MNNLSVTLKPLISAHDLLNRPEPERHWKVADTFEAGDRLIVTGNEGEGKSTLLRQWAIMIAAGIHPFTLQPIEPRRVVLMDLENSEEQIKKEIEKICGRAEIACPGPEFLQVASWPSGVDLTKPGFEMLVRNTLLEYPPDFLIGGPIYKMAEVSLSDESASRAVSAALDRLRETFEFAMILEAHQINEATAFDPNQKKWTKNRPMRPFGSSLWRRWPEFGLCLFTDGTLHNWRGNRQERKWPEKLNRDGDVWLWEPDTGVCPMCGNDRPDGKDRYCSVTCRERAKKRRQRAKGQQALLD